MNTNYTEALEQQARLLRMLNQKINSSERPIEYAGMGGRDFPQWFKIVSGGLTLGESYFLNEPVGRLIFQTANSLPEMRLSESLLSDRGYGFLWFSEPIRMPDLNGIPNMLRAISWC